MTIIQWLGQACFLIFTLGGAHILVDPPHPEIGYHIPKHSVPCDLVFVSHEHPDHNFVDAATSSGRGEPRDIPPITPPVPPNTDAYSDITYRYGSSGLPADELTARQVFSYHDNVQGQQRGPNTITVFNTGGLRIAHMGDIGQLSLTDEQIRDIGHVDILMIPVGGFYTVDGPEAAALVAQLKPRVIIPMHYKTEMLNPQLGAKLSSVWGFITAMKGSAKLVTVKSRNLKISPSTLPLTPTIYLLPYR